MTKQQQLDQIAADILADNVTPELAEQATQLVMGAGDPDADVVFIGEAPGKKEDQNGEPFVGASGKFLDVMLESINFKRSQIYITNIVKYRPPGNRDPKKAEKAEFTPYLERQLEVIQPKIVVTLGRHSGMFFLPDLIIGNDHGQPKRINLTKDKANKPNSRKTVILPLYHPAAALYDPGKRETLMFDFAKIQIILKKLNKR